MYENVKTAWRIVLDPGLGFSKETEDKLEILMGYKRIWSEIEQKSLGMSHAPLLIGTSRKRFLGEVCGWAYEVEIDLGTVVAVTSAVLCGANIVKVHNIGDNVESFTLKRDCHRLQYTRNQNSHVLILVSGSSFSPSRSPASFFLCISSANCINA